MCGIIGYTGSANAIPKITKGLSVLEYRGYDSVGIAARTELGVKTVKCKGRIGALEERLTQQKLSESQCAIGHTRWATHGGPSDTNAHPHRAGRVVLVHNGIIENYKELKEMLSRAKVSFLSETDTEVAAAVLNAAYDACNDPLTAIRTATAQMTGSYAFGILFDDHPGEVWAIRSGSPLILAKGEDGFYLASDMTALLPFTREYHILKEGEIARLTATEAALCGAADAWCSPTWSITSMTPESAQKSGFEHFMLKEIHEQPEAIVKSVSPRIKNGLPSFEADGISSDFWKQVKNIQIVACGSATHAGLVGGSVLERVAKVPAASYIASEYRYHPPIAVDGTLVVVISQSGETADTLAALRYAKSAGLPTLAIVNAVETTIAREADYRVYTYAGPEIAVATTKGYCTQVSVLYMIAAAIAHACGRISDEEARELVRSVAEDAPTAITEMLEKTETLREMSKRLAQKDHVFYIGRGLDYAMSQEAALKLKEISYIHAEAYAAGELKHGTISLIEQDTPVLAISTEEALYDKTESNVREVRSRGAYVILICRQDARDPGHSADEVILLPTKSEAATLFASLTAVQLLAYETAALRGCDIDRPRNLAKSVTVE
ncbi:MAG: glutamine--fructose-6-phosphate transaminase (isomerizing) [Ruminococcaceae bacterium]|nr:glutamine--fructose-6-phosphate transaminase (isomerizing) [Oscillospiraceae bacterium]